MEGVLTYVVLLLQWWAPWYTDDNRVCSVVKTYLVRFRWDVSGIYWPHHFLFRLLPRLYWPM